MYKLDRYLGSSPKKLRRALENQTPIRPLSVKIKLTWHCNLACVMCSEWRIAGNKPPRPNYFDSWERLQAVLDDLVALKTKKVHFSGGEPLMSPYLDQAVAYLSQRGRHVSLVSNGTLWTRSRARSLIQSGLSHITLSIDSLDPERFAQIRGRESWGQLMRGIEHIRTAIAQSPRPIKLKSNTVLTRDNYTDVLEFAHSARELGIDEMRLLPVDDLHTDARPLRLRAQEIEHYNREIAPQLAELAVRSGLMQSPQQAYPFGDSPQDVDFSQEGHYARGFYAHKLCFVPWLHSLIGADGRVHGCCMLKSEKQYIERLSPERSFAQIWQGEKYRRFRNHMAQERAPICAHCDDYLPENHYLNLLWQSTRSQSDGQQTRA